MKWAVYLLFIPGLIFSHPRWVKDQEVGIKVPLVLKTPYDYHKQVFRLPYAERIGLSNARVRMIYKNLRYGTYNLEVKLNYHILFKTQISDTGGVIEREIPPTWLTKYNTLEFNLSGTQSVGDALEIDSIWFLVDIKNREEFSNFSDFVEISEGIINIIFPEGKNVKTLSSLALFAQATGFFFGKTASIRVSSDAPGIRSGGIVVIGTPDEQPYISEIQSRIKELTGLSIARGYKDRLVWKSLRGESIGKNDGVVVFLFNDRGIPVIIASGNKPEGVWKSVTALVSENFSVEKNYRIIEEESEFIQRKWVAPPEGDFSLADLSWPGILLLGTEVDTVMRLNFLPGTKFAPGGHRLHIDFNVDRFLDVYTSSIKLFFNGRFLGKYSIAQVEKGLDVELRDLTTRNYLQIKAKLRGITQNVTPSLFISNSSKFHVPRSWSVKLPDLAYLRHLAFPFGATYKNIKPAIIIDQMEIKRFELGIMFSRFIGLSGVLNPALIFATSDSAKKRAKNRNLVLIGHEYDLLSPADSSLYVEEIIYPGKRLFRTFLILHCVNTEQINHLINLFSRPERLEVLSGARVNFVPSGVKVISPLSQREITHSSIPDFIYNPIILFIVAVVLVIFIIKIVRILRASA